MRELNTHSVFIFMCYSYLHRLAYAINHEPTVSLYILHVIFSPLLGKWTVDIVATHDAAW